MIGSHNLQFLELDSDRIEKRMNAMRPDPVTNAVFPLSSPANVLLLHLCFFGALCSRDLQIAVLAAIAAPAIWRSRLKRGR